MVVTFGSVDTLVVLFSINVCITFSLSQLGMVVHWWQERRSEPAWVRKLAINGFGLALTTFILISLTVVKFFEGGWKTLFVTGVLVAIAYAIKRHYRGVAAQLSRLDIILAAAEHETSLREPVTAALNPRARTAIILVNGFNGLGLHTCLHVPRMFGDTFRNFAFIQVGAVDAGNFKGAAELDALRAHATEETARYARWARAHGFGTATFTSIGHDVTSEVLKLARQAAEQFPNHVFFAGQLLFARETIFTRLLHNYTAFALQRRFYLESLPLVVLPIRVGDESPADAPVETEAAEGLMVS